MEIKIIRKMLTLGEEIGTIKKVNMFSENSIYIEGETEYGEKFNFNLTFEEDKENA